MMKAGAARPGERTLHSGERGVVILRRAWVKLSVLWNGRANDKKGRATGVHINYLHSDRDCSYLRPRRFDTSESRIIEVSGELLDILRWCSRCTPKRGCKPSVDYPTGVLLPVSWIEARPTEAATQLSVPGQDDQAADSTKGGCL